MDISRPVLADQRQMIRLPTKREQDSHWAGIPSLGPVLPGGVQPTSQLALVVMVFGRQFPVEDEPLVTLSSADGGVVIDSAQTWSFQVPPQPLLLPLGNYFWEIRTTDAAGVQTVHYAGSQLVAA